MKNLFFVGGNLYPNKVGGYEVFNYYLSDSLRKEFKLTVLNNIEVKNYPSSKYIRIFKLEPSAIFAPIQYLFYFFFLKDKKNILILLSYSKSRWLNWWVYPLIRRWLGIKYIVIIHGGGLSEWDFSYIHLQFFQKADRVIGVSKRICIEYEKRTAREVIYIPPLIPFEKCEEEKKSIKEKFKIAFDSKIILSVGSLKELKNPKTIIEAAGVLGVQYLKTNSLFFVFAGEGNLKSELMEKAKLLGIDEQVYFLGNISREEIPALYSISDIFIMCSDYEGTPLSLLEAMFNSLIVLGSDVRGINNIIQHKKNGFLFKLKDYSELAVLINEVLNMPFEEQIAIRQNAQKTIDEEYCFNTMLNRYIEIIQAI